MRKNARTWLLAVVCFTPVTPDPLDSIAVSTDAAKDFTAAQAWGSNQGIAMSSVPCYKDVQWRCCQKPSCQTSFSENSLKYFTLVALFGVFSLDLFQRRGSWDQVSALDVWGKQYLAAWVAGVAAEKSAAGLFWYVLCWMATWLLYPSWSSCCFCWAATWSTPVVVAPSWDVERLDVSSLSRLC